MAIAYDDTLYTKLHTAINNLLLYTIYIFLIIYIAFDLIRLIN